MAGLTTSETLKTKKMKYLLSMLLVLLSFTGWGQVCGDQCSHVDHDFENWLALRTAGNRESSYFTKYLPVAFHVFDGASNIEQVEEAFAILQEQMVGTNIIPCRHQTNFYNEHDSLETEHPIYDVPLYYQAMQANEIAGTPATDVCNIYIFSSVGSGVAGFSWVNSNPVNYTWDGIYLKAEHAATNVITHEMGHYCGLYHTFQNSNCGTIEADCETQGDWVCDTPPTSANLNCESPFCSGADYTNHMDYTQNYCRDHFTWGQIQRMHNMLVNGGRQSVWQSGLCVDPDLLDIGVLSVSNYNRCDEDYTPSVKVSNFTNVDADGVSLAVVMNGQSWDTLVSVPAQTIATFTGPALQGEYFGNYTGEAYITLVGDNDPDNNVNTFEHSPLPHAVMNIDIQHDVWPESEQWKFYKEGFGSSADQGALYYARGGNWLSFNGYDSWTDGFTLEPYFTHDEFCLTEGCYNGFFRHSGYSDTQEFWDYTWDFDGNSWGPYAGIECGVSVYVERGYEVDTLYHYFTDMWGADGDPLTGDSSEEWTLGWPFGSLSERVYDYCVDDLYLELTEPEALPCPGDFNGDGLIQIQDLLSICIEMGKVGECQCDMDGDADVDVQDFAAFLGVFNTSCDGEEMPPPTLKQLEEAGLRPVLIDMAGRRVTNPARGIYLAEIEVKGVKIYTKVLL